LNIPFVDLTAQQHRIRADLDQRIAAVLDHGAYILGPEVSELEAVLAARAGCRHVISVSSGTDALLAVLMAKDIGPGDAVFMPAFTFTATAEVILQVGATPVFVDVDETTFNLDADCLRAAIAQTVSDGVLHPAGVIAVDLFGQPADYRAINAIAAEHKLFVLGDAAQSFGASYENRAVGNLATATATSFYPAKPLGCYGDGGAIFTDDDDVAATCISIRNHGQSADRYDIVRLGLNARLDTLQAAVLLSKLTIFDDEIRLRRCVARRYTERLGDHAEAIETPIEMPGRNSIWAEYTIKLAAGRRDDIAAALKARGIPSQIYYPLPMHLQPAYLPYGGGPGSLPVSEQLSKQVLALPMHPYLDDAAIDMICDTLIDAIP